MPLPATGEWLYMQQLMLLWITSDLLYLPQRMSELARPIVRDTMDHVQFNPDAFNVSPAALKAKTSARIEELAQPIQRGA